MAAYLNIKQGGTLLLDCVCTRDDGTPIDLTSAQLAAEPVDASGEGVGPLIFTLTDAAAGLFTMGATSAQTAAWPVGQLACDICFQQNGNVIYSDIFYFRVRPTMTPPP